MNATAARLLGVREAARELGLNASTVSRYLARNPELNRGTDARPLVDVAELRDHRAGNVNFAMSGNHVGRLLDDPDDDGEAVAPAPSGERRSPARGTYSQAKAARETIQARTAQLVLEEKLRAIVSRSAVEDAAFEAGQLLQAELAARNKVLAERLATTDDPRAIRAMLDDEDRKLLDRLANALERSLGNGTEEDAT